MAYDVNISASKDMVMRVTILRKRWNLLRNHSGPKNDGYCDPPDARNKSIRVHSGLRGERELEILIHEMLHAADWSKDEEWVEEFSKDLARVLWRIGYRKHKLP